MRGKNFTYCAYKLDRALLVDVLIVYAEYILILISFIISVLGFVFA